MHDGARPEPPGTDKSPSKGRAGESPRRGMACAFGRRNGPRPRPTSAVSPEQTVLYGRIAPTSQPSSTALRSGAGRQAAARIRLGRDGAPASAMPSGRTRVIPHRGSADDAQLSRNDEEPAVLELTRTSVTGWKRDVSSADLPPRSSLRSPPRPCGRGVTGLVRLDQTLRLSPGQRRGARTHRRSAESGSAPRRSARPRSSPPSAQPNAGAFASILDQGDPARGDGGQERLAVAEGFAGAVEESRTK